MKLLTAKKNSHGLGFVLIFDTVSVVVIGFLAKVLIIYNGYGFGIGFVSWPWVILDYPGLNFWHRLCSCDWFSGKSADQYQIRYMWFTVVYLFPFKIK